MQNHLLFFGIIPERVPALLRAIGAEKHRYRAQEMIFMQGAAAERIGIVESGSVLIYSEDVFGGRTIIGEATEGDIFAEAFACAGLAEMPVSVQAKTQSTVCLFPFACLKHENGDMPAERAKMLGNLLHLSARKNILLSEKLRIMSMKTTRDKLMAYLSGQSLQHSSVSFDIPFNRQELADYLGVDRSAMAAEIGRMRRDGLIDSEKNHFLLKSPNHCE